MEWNYLHFRCSSATVFLSAPQTKRRGADSATKHVTNYQKFRPHLNPRGSHTKVCTISVTYAPGLIILITGITFVVAGMRRTFSHVPLSLALLEGFRGSLLVWVLYEVLGGESYLTSSLRTNQSWMYSFSYTNIAHWDHISAALGEWATRFRSSLAGLI